MNMSAMTYGAILSAVLASVLVVFVGRDRRPAVLLTAAASALVAPLCWNTILRTTGASSAFSHDLPSRPCPISWQDVGSGVFTLALASTAFALGAAAADLPRRVAVLAAWTALGALLVDALGRRRHGQVDAGTVSARRGWWVSRTGGGGWVRTPGLAPAPLAVAHRTPSCHR